MYTSKEMQVVAVTNRSLCHRPFSGTAGNGLSDTSCVLSFCGKKDLPAQKYEKLAAQVLELCHSYEVPCVLHTYPDAARALGCTSIHLPLPLLREYAHELNDFTQIGSSVHSVEDAMEAERLGATYVTAGHVYVTDCKKGAGTSGTGLFKKMSVRAYPSRSMPSAESSWMLILTRLHKIRQQKSPPAEQKVDVSCQE